MNKYVIYFIKNMLIIKNEKNINIHHKILKNYNYLIHYKILKKKV